MTAPEAAKLLAWFDENAREMPWRGSSDPYAILVCEVMSQQTRIETVLDYWQRWMVTFPDVQTLAAADVDEVMRHWAGLGYYRRARNLHACAVVVVEQLGGKLPKTSAELRELPGIGPYTAAAIASIVYDEPVLALDGNVARVAARVAGIFGDPTKAAFRNRAEEVGLGLMDAARAGASNEALMELGATVCTPRAPECGICPIENGCFARGLDDPTQLPEPKPRKAPRRETRQCLVMVLDDHVWMRKGAGNLLGGLFEFPPPEDVPQAGRIDVTNCGQVEHIFSHIRMSYEVFRVDLAEDVAPAGGQWLGFEVLENEALSSAMVKVARVALRSTVPT